MVLAAVSNSLFAVDYPITDFGASQKGLATASIQAAIDKYSSEGGGRVVIPRGTWTSGTVELKNGVILFLEPGAVLKGSTKREDYSKNFIRAVKATGIGVEGYGTVDGSGYAFWKVTERGGYEHDRPVPATSASAECGS